MGKWALGTPEGKGPQGWPGTSGSLGMAVRSHQPCVDGECSLFLPFPYFREDPPGFEAKEDYPLSKEELLSYVMKSVRTGAAWAGQERSCPMGPNPAPPQMEAREQSREQHLKELMEMAKKMDSSLSMSLSSTQKAGSGTPLVIPRSPSIIPGSIMSHRTNGILMSTGGHATSSNIGHVTFGDPSSTIGHMTLSSTSASQSSTGGRMTFRARSPSSHPVSTGYMESSGGPESFGGKQRRGTTSELSAGPASSTSPGSTMSKDSQSYD